MYKRALEQQVRSSLETFRVTVVNGPRQSGKTTLLKAVTATGGTYITLDDDDQRARARHDPTAFLERAARPIAIDEIQRGGDEVVLAIKAAVDRNDRRGAFLLAGSTRFLSVPSLSESLAGRAEILDLWPLAQSEIRALGTDVLDRLLADPAALEGASVEPLARAETADVLVRGGYPEAIVLEHDFRRRWFRSYLRTVIDRDVVTASSIRQASELPRLLRLVAANSAGELVPNRLAGDARLSEDVTRRYLGLLELVGLVVRIPAWTPSLTTREKRHAKAVISDTGLAAALLGIDAGSLAAPMTPTLGPLLETFVATEILKLVSWSSSGVTVRHWRDRNGAEVDLVLEWPNGEIVAIEVKSASVVRAPDVRHLERLRDGLGDRFRGGLVLHLGDQVTRFADRIWTAPVSALWATS